MKKVLSSNHRSSISDGIRKYHDKKGRTGTILKNGYKMIQIRGKRVYEHRLVWSNEYGEIPKGKVVHHKNEDKLDNRIENLELMCLSQHAKMHRSGKIDSDETCIKKSKALRKSKISDQKILELRESGMVLNKIAKIAGISESGICYRLKRIRNFPNKTWIK